MTWGQSYRFRLIASSEQSGFRFAAIWPYSGVMDQVFSPSDASPALQRYVELLQRWNRSINLVSARDIPVLWTRHVADSLQLGTLWRGLPERAIDLGSGGGFPGLVLAIQYGVHFDLIEQDQAKAAFLREAARVTGAPVTVIAVKLENAVLPRAPLITARGLAPLARLLGYAEKLLTPGGECLFLKSRGVAAEIAEAASGWAMDVEQIRSSTDDNGVILRVSGIARR
jgi:16S rRNA (guanine527-N7)-methyltransferase